MRPKRVRRTLPNVLVSLAAVFFSLTALVAFAHTKAGRPLLAWVSARLGHGAARCPLGYDRAVSPADRQAFKARFASTHRGEALANARPALGFTLDVTTRSDVLAWARANDVRCSEKGAGPADVSCADVTDTALPAPFRGVGTQALWFAFGQGERLLSVVAASHTRAPEPVAAAYATVTSTLDRGAGEPQLRTGDASPALLASAALYQASSEYRFRDYYAVARATNMGAGYAFTAEYRSLTD